MIIHLLGTLLPLGLAGIAWGATPTYDYELGNITLMLASNVYCSPETYLTRVYPSHAKSFSPTHHIQVEEDTTEGVIGYSTPAKTIFVVFRGSETLQNWIDDLSVGQRTYPHCEDCFVHKGFYSAALAAFPAVLPAVQALKKKFPKYRVLTTGHSLGAALATLTAIELLTNDVKDVWTIHFGSPRVGNANFAVWASKSLGAGRHFRHTHQRDIAVHYPLHERYMHVDGELYEDPDLSVRMCDGFEDPTCSYQWGRTNIDDHLLYMGQRMGMSGCEDTEAEN